MPPTQVTQRGGLKSTRKSPVSPADQIKQSIKELLIASGIFSLEDIDRLLKEVPHKWERHGDLIVVPQRSLQDDLWKSIGNFDDNKIY